MKETCEAYVRRARLFGALYSIVPTVLWSVGSLIVIPFRPVYTLRIVLSLFVGGVSAAVANDIGTRLWVAKHRSPAGPASAAEGMFVGAAVGLFSVLLPPLTMLISSNHPEDAKTFIIAMWLAGPVIGGTLGGIFGAIGSRHLDRD